MERWPLAYRSMKECGQRVSGAFGGSMLELDALLENGDSEQCAVTPKECVRSQFYGLQYHSE
ncbi:hypothetical protein Tco_0430605, partial [Tanacetum coccineum]